MQDSLTRSIEKYVKKIPPHAFYIALPQLLSSVAHENKLTAEVVEKILVKVLSKFPHQAMWPLAWLRNSKMQSRQEISRRIFTSSQQALNASKKPMEAKLLVASESLITWLHKAAKFVPPDKASPHLSVTPWKGEVDLTEFIPPVQAALTISSAASTGSSEKDLFHRQVPRMTSFYHKVAVMASKARPKRLKAFVTAPFSSINFPKGSKEKRPEIGEIHFLAKREAKGDLRKDARVQDLNNVINRLLSSSRGDSFENDRKLNLRTFAVTCLSEDTGILEWVPDTASMRSLISKTYNPHAAALSSKRRGVRLTSLTDPKLRDTYEKCQKIFLDQKRIQDAARHFQELIVKECPPLFYWWFIQNFHDAHRWYEARLRFTLSSASWSAVGHIIGLGDRHAENILIDTNSGECVHVDFDCLFDKGLSLPRPEVVPFRLTANMIDAFGPTGADGVYRCSMKQAMRVLRENKNLLLSVLEPFVKDPIIDWKRTRSQQRTNPRYSQDSRFEEAKRSIRVLDERLQGIYNLPNGRAKYQSGQGGLMDEEEITNLMPLSVEGQVQKLISEATNLENLVQLYVGWMPWL